MPFPTQESQDSSPTPTPTPDEAARSPTDTGPIDAEVVEETSKARPPRVARVADVKRLESTADDVFGGAVTDTVNARAARPPGDDGAPTPKRGRSKKKAEAPPSEPSDKHVETARGLLLMADSFFVAHVRSRYADALEPENVEQLARKCAATPEQVNALAEPLARGLAEENVELPWWAQLGLAASGVYLPKLMMLSALDEQVAAKKKAGP